MNILHDPIFDTDKIAKHYSEKDGVPIKYVCTSSANVHGTVAVDIFYRETPHPQFGNRYFGLYVNMDDQIMITGADAIEDLEFDMLDIDGELVYSQHRHDYRTHGDAAIDGGRAYLKVAGNINRPVVRLEVKDGEFVKRK